MATGAEVQEAKAALEGKPTTSLEAMFVKLRRDGLLPTAKQGGRSGSVEFEADHLAMAMFSSAVHRPSDAPRVVRSLDALPYRGSVPKEAPAPGHHLGSVLVGDLARLAAPFSRGEPLTHAEKDYVDSWELTICLDPLFAQIKANDGSGYKAHFFHNSEIGRARATRHLTILTGEYLLTFSKLLADTYIQQNAVAAVKFLDATKPAKAGQEQESAGNRLRQETIPALLVDHSRANGSGSLTAPEDIHESENSQGCEGPGRDGQHSTREFDCVPSDH